MAFGEVLRAGKAVRFRVEDPVLGSGFSWVVDTRPAGDVYITCREAGAWLKVSLHKSGRWHYAVTDRGRDAEPAADAYLDVGRQRDEIAAGVLLGVRIWVPVSELRVPEGERSTGKWVVSVPVAAGYDSVFVEVYLTKPNADPVRVEKAALIARFDFPNGDQAHVVARAVNTGKDVHDVLEPDIAQAEGDLRARFGWDGSPTRIVIASSGDEMFGFKQQVEIALG